jgi:hypothetical protein
LCSVVEGRAERTKAAAASSASRSVGGGGGEGVGGEAPAASAAAAAYQNDGGEEAAEEDGAVERSIGNDAGEEAEADAGGGGNGKKGGGGGLPDLTAENKRLEELEQEIWQMAGREFKITSYVELSRVLFEDLKLPVVKQPTNKVLGGVRGAWVWCGVVWCGVTAG